MQDQPGVALQRRPQGSRAAAADGRLARAAETLLLILLALAPWAYGGAPDPARFALAAGVFVALALWALDRARGDAGPLPLVPCALGLPVWALVQALSGVSVAPLSTLDAALLLLAFLGAAAFWARRAGQHGPARRLAGVVLAVAAVQGTFGAVQHALAPGRVYGAATPLVTMPFGSYVNHNHFAGFVGMAALLAAGLAWGHARRMGEPAPGTVALGGLALGLAATLFASKSRGGLLALGAGVVALVALRGLESAWKREVGGGRRLAAGAALTLAAGLVAAFLLVPRATRAHLLGLFTGAGAADTSSAYRLDTAAATWSLFAQRPLLGAGSGAYADAITPHKRAHGDVRSLHAESDVLEALAEGGLVGLGLWAWLAARVGRGLRERLQHGRDALRTGLTAGAGAALVGLGTHSLFDFNLRLPANALVAASLLGLVAAGRRPSDAGETTGRAPWRRPLALVAAAGLTLLACVAGWRALGAWRLERALALPAAQRLGALDRVLAAHPWRAEAWRARGLAWRDLRRGEAPSPANAARLARAERDLSQALHLRPAWADAWADRAWVRLLRGDAAAAREDADRAAALDPTHVGISLIRAEIHARGGAIDEALRQLAGLLDRDPAWAGAAIQAALRWTDSAERVELLVGGDPRRAELLREARRSRGASGP